MIIIRRRRIAWRLAGSLVVIAMLSGCGITTQPSPTPQVYSVTVNAMSASGTLQHTATVMATVQ